MILVCDTWNSGGTVAFSLTNSVISCEYSFLYITNDYSLQFVLLLFLIIIIIINGSVKDSVLYNHTITLFNYV